MRTVSGTHRNVTEDGQQDVDEEVGIATTLEEDTERRDEDGEDDLDDVAEAKVRRLCMSEAAGWEKPSRGERERTLR
jgi:hypothetical protein